MQNWSFTINETPNPAILKFESDQAVVASGNYEFAGTEEAAVSPLAQHLFDLPFVKAIYISGNFIAIERFENINWKDVQSAVAEQIADYLNSGGTIIKLEANDKTQQAVSVYAESTPNPAVLKLVCNILLSREVKEYKTKEQAAESPLAFKLLEFTFIDQVFIYENYVSVTKKPEVEWLEITSTLRNFISNYLKKGGLVFNENLEPRSDKTALEQEPEVILSETAAQINHILETQVKPAVAADGGNIKLKNYDENSKTVEVILQGACSGCPSSTYTLKNGIEAMLKDLLHDKVEEVIAFNE